MLQPKAKSKKMTLQETIASVRGELDPSELRDAALRWGVREKINSRIDTSSLPALLNGILGWILETKLTQNRLSGLNTVTDHRIPGGLLVAQTELMPGVYVLVSQDQVKECLKTIAKAAELSDDQTEWLTSFPGVSEGSQYEIYRDGP